MFFKLIWYQIIHLIGEFTLHHRQIDVIHHWQPHRRLINDHQIIDKSCNWSSTMQKYIDTHVDDQLQKCWWWVRDMLMIYCRWCIVDDQLSMMYCVLMINFHHFIVDDEQHIMSMIYCRSIIDDLLILTPLPTMCCTWSTADWCSTVISTRTCHPWLIKLL